MNSSSTQFGDVPVASLAEQHLLGHFPTYALAEALVDKLSDGGFPVERSRIVGTGLRSVEYVTGRFTTTQAGQAGAASGAWFGLLIGLLLGMFSDGSAVLVTMLGCAVFGALWGGAFGYLAQRSTHGRRDFASVRGLEATEYTVSVDVSHADHAMRISGQL